MQGLINALSDKDNEVIKTAEASIRALGKNAACAIAVLREKTMCEDLWVQTEAHWAIYAIEDDK